MKIQGQEIYVPYEVTIVIPRQSENIVLKAKGVEDFSEFEEILPQPKPKYITDKNGTRPDTNDPDYIKKVEDWSKKHLTWIILKSLEATEGLEWDTVDISDPSTYDNLETELKSSGFNDREVVLIMSKCMDANSLNDKTIKQAEKDFLAGQEKAQIENFRSLEVQAT